MKIDFLTKLQVSEIFGPTLQGEGQLIGAQTIFVRLGGCDYRCSWCDTLYAVLPENKPNWHTMTARQIMTRVDALAPDGNPLLVTLSGGNPALYDLTGLLAIGRSMGYTFALETQGSVAKQWFSELHYLTLSPKPPSSGEAEHFDPNTIKKCIEYSGNAQVSIKVPVQTHSEEDVAFAEQVRDLFPNVPMFLQPVNPKWNQAGEPDVELLNQGVRWIHGEIKYKASMANVRILPQLHVYLYGNQRGV